MTSIYTLHIRCMALEQYFAQYRFGSGFGGLFKWQTLALALQLLAVVTQEGVAKQIFCAHHWQDLSAFRDKLGWNAPRLKQTLRRLI